MGLYYLVYENLCNFLFSASTPPTELAWAESALTIATLVVIVSFTVFVFTSIFRILKLFMRW